MTVPYSFVRIWKESQGFRLLLLNPPLTCASCIFSLIEEFRYSKSELLLSSACTLYPAHYSRNPFISSALYHRLVFILVPSFARLNIYTHLIFSLLLKRTIQTLNNNNKVLYCLNLILHHLWGLQGLLYAFPVQGRCPRTWTQAFWFWIPAQPSNPYFCNM